ncbi:MAG: 50S ribosomal protein L17 [Flavobacteriales bacterium]|nr:50S ribosomal protein L17 [Flavobacteriales bacterium]|tara:strand:+ start:280 stop:951 length:672 start_codon:yes stop_codon:yes gene_type:complete
MRHGKKFNHLGRKAAHRKAMLANMACSLIEHKRIKTTVPKAKALRKYVEPLITKSKNDTTHSRRTVFSYLKQKEAITELFGDVAAKVANRKGGYTRILKTGNRLGDNAEMCIIELVDYNDTYTTDRPKKKAKSTRRSSAKKAAEAVVEETLAVEEVKTDKENPVEEAVAEEAPAAEAVVEETLAVEEVKTEKENPVEEAVAEEAPDAEKVQEENAKEDEQKSE